MWSEVSGAEKGSDDFGHFFFGKGIDGFGAVLDEEALQFPESLSYYDSDDAFVVFLAECSVELSLSELLESKLMSVALPYKGFSN